MCAKHSANVSKTFFYDIHSVGVVWLKHLAKYLLKNIKEPLDRLREKCVLRKFVRAIAMNWAAVSSPLCVKKMPITDIEKIYSGYVDYTVCLNYNDYIKFYLRRRSYENRWK